MKDFLRCFISCIIPCGALDVIRIVHPNGRVEEIGSRSLVIAADIMEAYPNHVLRKLPSSTSSADVYDFSAAPRRAVTLPPAAELNRGKIYFLIAVAGEKKGRRERFLLEREKRKRKMGVWRPRLESISEFYNEV